MLTRNNALCLEYVLLNSTARVPTKVTPEAAGFDLYSNEEITIPSGETRTIKTGLSVGIPSGYYGQIATKSGFAVRGLTVLGGIVDSDYTGQIMVIMHNLSPDHVHLPVGNKVAQLIIHSYVENAYFQQSLSSLPDSVRGAAGFGALD